MPAFPTILTDAITVSTSPATVTYDEIVRSQGAVYYRLINLFFQTSSIAQLIENYQFVHTTPDGNQDVKLQIAAIDPYQSQLSYKLPIKGKPVILDGFTRINFNLLAGESMSLQLTVRQKGNADLLKAYGSDLFKEMGNRIGQDKFFDSNIQQLSHE